MFTEGWEQITEADLEAAGWERVGSLWAHAALQGSYLAPESAAKIEADRRHYLKSLRKPEAPAEPTRKVWGLKIPERILKSL